MEKLWHRAGMWVLQGLPRRYGRARTDTVLWSGARQLGLLTAAITQCCVLTMHLTPSHVILSSPYSREVWVIIPRDKNTEAQNG